jgi:hypothetical protein
MIRSSRAIENVSVRDRQECGSVLPFEGAVKRNSERLRGTLREDWSLRAIAKSIGVSAASVGGRCSEGWSNETFEASGTK